MENDFYFQFEEKFRGDRDTIIERLRAYDPFLKKISKIFPAAKCIDLGCGRGEWLQLLAGYGFKVSGVDLAPPMIEACKALELDVTEADAIQTLALLEADSHAIVSGFHIAEHLEFELLHELILQAHRVLLPGGILILETPNPENFRVASLNFHLDPTHKKPIPPQLLQFLADYCGFTKNYVFRLNHDPEMLKLETVSLRSVLNGASPDYAVIGQKHASKKILKMLAPAFSETSGITAEELADGYEANQTIRFAETRSLLESENNRAHTSEILVRQAEERVQSAETRVKEAEKRVRAAENRSAGAETRAANAEQRAVSAETQAAGAEARATNAEQRAVSAETQAAGAEARATNAEQRAVSAETQAVDAAERAQLAAEQAQAAVVSRNQVESELLATRRSLSWRITYPLRLLADILIIRPFNAGRRAANRLLAGLINAFEIPLAGLMKFCLRYPRVTALADKSLSRLPFLRSHLMQILATSDANHGATNIAITSEEQSLTELSPRARQIHADLKAAMNSNR